jgi:hypothetical protein
LILLLKNLNASRHIFFMVQLPKRLVIPILASKGGITNSFGQMSSDDIPSRSQQPAGQTVDPRNSISIIWPNILVEIATLDTRVKFFKKKLIGTGAANGSIVGVQSCSIALSGDGNTAIVGGYGDNGNAGAAWIFTRP